MPTKRILAPTVLGILFATLLLQLPFAIADRATVYEWFDPIVDVRRILLDDFVNEPDETRMQRAMIDGMIETLDDDYTEYIPPAELDNFNKQLRGTYAGIGAEVNIGDDYLTIVTAMDDSPALRAGVMAGDIVLVIDGVSTFEKRVSECVELLTGEIGTDVVIRVRHLDGTEEDLTITRDRIVTRTVRGLRRNGEDWAFCLDAELGLSYVRITQFNAATVPELREALDEIQANGLNGLILDLRENPGGALPTAVAMANLFLESGLIVTVRNRDGSVETYSAQRAGTLPDFPMVILINGASASASEIIAGALQENGRARVLGMRSFGKGSVQEVLPLRYGAGTLKFTNAHYYLPSGRNLNRSSDSVNWGVDPDPGMVVAVSDRDYFDVLKARRDYEIIRAPDPAFEPCVDATWIRTNLKDEQLALAVESVSTRMAGEAWPEPTKEDSATVAFDRDLDRRVRERIRLLELLEEIEASIDELQGLASEAGHVPLLPPDVDYTDGIITIADKHGNVIGSYRVEGGNLPLALRTLTLEPVTEESP